MVDKLLLNKLGYTIVFAFFVIFIDLLIIVNCTGTEIKKSVQGIFSWEFEDSNPSPRTQFNYSILENFISYYLFLLSVS